MQRYAEFCDQEYLDILKHVNVLWLCLEKAAENILLQYVSLMSYFQSEETPKPINANGAESKRGGGKIFKRYKKGI